MIPTNILQSMLALNATEIDRESILCISYKDLRNHMSKGGARVMAKKWHKKVVKSKKRIAILSRNQKEIKIALQFMYQHEDFERLCEAEDYLRYEENY